MTNRTQRTTPGSRLLLLGLLSGVLASCGGGTEPPPPPPAEQAGLILGQITPFKVGDTANVKYAENNTETPFVQAPVDAGGKFTINFPNHSAVTTTHQTRLIPTFDLFGICTNPTDQSTSGLKILPVPFLYTDQFKRLILRNTNSGTADNYKVWWFATQDGTVKFKASDCLGLGDVDMTVNVKRGWNVLNVVTETGVKTTYALTTQPTGTTTWTYYLGQTALQAHALELNIFEPWKNLPQYQNR